ncbi:hypothetical protein HMPREF1986_01462 [Oribacterium sp. oral taxon 078 str. F0263]|nr:hypothetical protein HMPREF1986_01462 [Oribacterium sp. oral taxon 078 str. F0263]
MLLPVFPLLYRLSCDRRSHGFLFLRQNPGSRRLSLPASPSLREKPSELLQRCPSHLGGVKSQPYSYSTEMK